MSAARSQTTRQPHATAATEGNLDPASFIPAKHARWKGPVRSLANLIGCAVFTAATGGFARWVAPFQVRYHDLDMAIRGLPRSLDGFRIAQVTDLHTGRTTPVSFLRKVIEHVNRAKPDLIAVTGDLVSHSMRWVEPACDLLSHLDAPAVVIFGNHDYARTWRTWSSSEVADALHERLSARGVTVLRNSATPVDRPDGRLWIAGTEDLWSGKFDPAATFASIPEGEPVVTLTHNPDAALELAPFGPQWILAGHTHGGQIRVPVAGPVMLPIHNKHFDGGLFQIGDSKLYVCRGIGFRRQVRFRCPPEVPTFVLRSA